MIWGYLYFRKPPCIHIHSKNIWSNIHNYIIRSLFAMDVDIDLESSPSTAAPSSSSRCKQQCVQDTAWHLFLLHVQKQPFHTSTMQYYACTFDFVWFCSLWILVVNCRMLKRDPLVQELHFVWTESEELMLEFAELVPFYGNMGRPQVSWIHLGSKSVRWCPSNEGSYPWNCPPGHTALVLTVEPVVVAQHSGLRPLHSAGPRISRGGVPERSGAKRRATGPRDGTPWGGRWMWLWPAGCNWRPPPTSEFNLWYFNITIEHHHFPLENPLFLWPFSIATFVYQRGPRVTDICVVFSCHLSAACHRNLMQLRLDVERSARIWWVCCHCYSCFFHASINQQRFYDHI